METFDPVHGAMVGKSVIYPYYLLRHLASVEMFDEIGMDSLIEKKCYNLYLEFILHEIDKEVESTLKSLLLQIKKRELALSVLLHGEGRSLNT
jgi:kynureninase